MRHSDDLHRLRRRPTAEFTVETIPEEPNVFGVAYLNRLPGKNGGTILDIYVAIASDCVWVRSEIVESEATFQQLFDELEQMVESIRFEAHVP